LNAVCGELRPPLTVLTRRIVLSLYSALVRITTLALEKEFKIFPPAKATY
jgi:hypothetical protein